MDLQMVIRKMKNRNYVIAFFLLMVLSGCETVIDVDVPEEDAKLVVFAFINPHDEFLKVNVRQSNPVFATTEFSSWQSLDDATVKITGPNGAVVIPFDEDEQAYRISSDSLPIISNESYRLDVSAPGFKSVFATTLVPAEVPLFTSTQLEVKEEIIEQGYSLEVFKFDLSWQDNADFMNYYEISIQQFNSELEYHNFDDGGRNGQIISERIESYSGTTGEFAEPFHIYLLNTTEEYFLYRNSIRNISFGDPFAEPSQVYSNITHGIGCFAAYTGTSVFITP
jgi:hypothetical protein